MTCDLSKKVITTFQNQQRKRARSMSRRIELEDPPAPSRDRCVAQSDVYLAEPDGQVTQTTQETTTFAAEPSNSGVDLSAPMSSLTRDLAMQQTLASYLSRVKLIQSYAWAENGPNGLRASINPWAAFLSDANIAAKLRGYSLVRGDLNLRFNVNGSQFYYGCMMANYSPLAGYRTDTANTGSVSVRLVAQSQKPHVWLENQNMSQVEMKLPFLYPYPYLDISQSANAGDFGTLQLWQYVPLLSANGVTGQSVDIQVYAWMTDVKLSGPTDRAILQSEVIYTAAKKAATTLKLGVRQAAHTAVDAASNAVSDIFGFTNTPVTEDVRPFKQMPFQLASTAIGEPVHKLSLHPEQSTTVGGVQHGAPAEDELIISRFASRESFLVATEWTNALTPGTPLFTTQVLPDLFQSDAGICIAHTPLSYASEHFQYWRGSIKFTFKVIKSPFHKGRFQVGWDRLTTDLSQGPTVGNPNTFTTVFDLEGDDERSVIIPYMHYKQYLSTFQVPDIPAVSAWSTNSVPTGTFVESNGVLSVRVVNRLTAPEASAPVTIMVFVSGCDDIQFASPTEPTITGAKTLTLSPALTGVAQSHVVYDERPGEPNTFTALDMAPDANAECFGERVVSFRDVLHRSSLAVAYPQTGGNTTAGLGSVTFPLKRLPPPPGVYNNGWNVGNTSAGAGQSVNYTKLHMLHTIGQCFIGYKGSVNVTANLDQTLGSICDTMYIERTPFGDALPSASRRPFITTLTLAANTTAANMDFLNRNVPSGRNGRALTNTRTNTGLSANLPYYSGSGFQIMDLSKEYNNQDRLTDSDNDWWRLVFRYNRAASNGALTLDGSLMSVYYGTGPDFDLVYFINVPILSAVTITSV